MKPTENSPQLDDSSALALIVATIRAAAAQRPADDDDEPDAYERWTRTMAGAAHEVAGILRADGRL
jgi:hypothetical protein